MRGSDRSMKWIELEQAVTVRLYDVVCGTGGRWVGAGFTAE